MVGIGSGVLSDKHEVRLGDVVVSAPRDSEGGVFQYDFAGIQALYKRKGYQLDEAISSIVKKNARLCREYERPQSRTDRPFKPKSFMTQEAVLHFVRMTLQIWYRDASGLNTRIIMPSTTA
ncbi:uncharacterized protein N7477_001246 [Penicillium maclennaniae]|uniref:uncharacterized protein n=1 Tax=Penicillium maclennaniae TaxID=1343394 RepID=UPI00253FCCAD|nr:uncharacterized protein N7477_001246 [Penicillium maclennaniae]KAJ5681306.1 hypothetical protein N7477_001246 [Penicillium maclennaniae]